jgi:hypothetical protein
VTRLRDLRAESLGRSRDELQERAEQHLASRLARETGVFFAGTGIAGVDPDPAPLEPVLPSAQGRTKVAVVWFPPDQFPLAVEKWPEVAGDWAADTYTEYCQELQRSLLQLRQAGIRPDLAPVDVAVYARWCAEEGLNPVHRDARARFATWLGRRGETRPWSPGRNDSCWCGSARKYKKCCDKIAVEPLV